MDPFYSKYFSLTAFITICTRTASQVTIAGNVLGDVFAKGSTLRVLGVVMGDIFASPGQVELVGTHLGDLL